MFITKKQAVRRTAVFGAFIIALLIVTNAKAAGQDLSQPLTVSWTKGFSPSAFFAYDQKLSYRFTITSRSNQVNYVHVFAEGYAQPAKVFPTSTLTRTYKLLPGKSIDILYQAYAPSGAVFDGPSVEFKMDASIEAEGYPSLSIGANAWYDTGK